MKITLSFLLLLFSVSTNAATWKKFSGGVKVLACPPGYLYVSPLAPYTTRNFCVMKYEAKKDEAGMPESVAAGTPWLSITRNNAQLYCQALGHGYELISNNEWQSIARNIAGVKSNWSNNTVASGEINIGHSDNSPPNSLAASTDDNDSCIGTEETCSSTAWHSQKRTHLLSSGDYIWDFSGNIGEWVNTDVTATLGSNANISSFIDGGYMQVRHGAHASTMCSSPSTNNYCGFGYATIATGAGAILKGGAYNTSNAGIFFTNTANNTTTPQVNIGFRCTFTP